MIKYELVDVLDDYTGEVTKQNLCRIEDDGKVWWIPKDPANSDYQRYLRWLEDPEAEENGTIS